MNKYIDAEKLIAEIEKLLAKAKNDEEKAFTKKDAAGHLAAVTKTAVCVKIKKLIATLQQEQLETDMKSPFTGGKIAILSREEEVTFRGEKIKVTRKYYRCADTGREFTDSKLDNDMMWAVFRTYCEKKGMTSFTDIMLKQEQPEVDLDREIIKYKVPFTDEREYLNETTLDAVARHFYELGLNARKEE